MRQLATLPRDQAQLLADHLLTLQIDTRLDDEPAGTVIWVRDEDRLPQARAELAEFQKDPAAPRYHAAPEAARTIRQREHATDAAYDRRQREVNRRLRQPEGSAFTEPVTLALLLVSILIALITQFGEDKKSPVLQALWIVPTTPDGEKWFPGRGLSAITQEGQVWRLVTPCLVHLSPVHLLFNMLALIGLGGALERRIGSWAFLGLALLIGAVSNVAEFYVQFGANVPGLLSLQPQPAFGGLSGVLYGVFGFLWVRSWVADNPEAVLSTRSVALMLVWLVLCMTGAVGPIANTAHVVGLLVGMGVAWPLNVWKKR